MKIKTIKILMMAGLFVMLGQGEAMASSTLVTFSVPLKIASGTTVPGEVVICYIEDQNNNSRTRREGHGQSAAPVQSNMTVIKVRVHSDQGKRFHKGDPWHCGFRYKGKQESSHADMNRGTWNVSGTL